MLVNATFASAYNLSQPLGDEPITKPLDICALVFMGIIFVFGIFCNLFTACVISCLKKRPSSTYDLLIVFLSISDLLCVIVVPAIFAYGTITRFQRWAFGLIGCKILLSVLPVNVTVSQGILLLMSIDRYLVISRPFQRNGFSKRSATLYVIITIVIAILLVLPRTYALELHSNPQLSTRTCTTPGSSNSLMLSYACINFLRDIISTVVLAASGRKLYSALMTNSSNMAKYGYMGSNCAANMSSIKQTHKILRLILIAFSLCTIPLDAFQFCVYLFFQMRTTVSNDAYFWIRSVNTVLYLCQTSNAVINVFIYGARHRDFKPVLRRLSQLKRELLFKIVPKAQGVDLENRYGSRSLAMIPNRCGKEVQAIRMVRFAFDGRTDDH